MRRFDFIFYLGFLGIISLLGWKLQDLKKSEAKLLGEIATLRHHQDSLLAKSKISAAPQNYFFGKAVPKFSLPYLDDKQEFSFQKSQNSTCFLFIFFSPWDCPSCFVETPFWNQLKSTFKNRLTVLAIGSASSRETLREFGLAVSVWRQRLSQIILIAPVVLLGVLIFGYWNGADCGCFGSLPFLSQFSLGSHFLLLAGIFFGLYYLTASEQQEEKTISKAKSWYIGKMSKLLRLTGLTALVMMVSAFFTLPFSFSDNHDAKTSDHVVADRTVVETAISNHSARLIDARLEFQYEQDHLPGAINIPYDSDSLIALIEKHSLKNQALIIYCSSAHCNAAELLAEKLRELGCKQVRVYPGGWEEWVSGREGEGAK